MFPRKFAVCSAWVPSEIDRLLWVPSEIYSSRWIPSEIYSLLWVPSEIYSLLWVPSEIYSLLLFPPEIYSLLLVPSEIYSLHLSLHLDPKKIMYFTYVRLKNPPTQAPNSCCCKHLVSSTKYQATNKHTDV